MHVLVTGHTGFKGAWLTLLLQQQGHSVSGIALDPQPGSLFDLLELSADLVHDYRVDIRNATDTRDAVQAIDPDIVLHLAAQPLVRASYAEPRWTMETNVMGTLSVLEAIGETESVHAAVMVTTDKVYRNTGKPAGYVESDPLGGHDPYSASKAMADILISSWVDSFGGSPIAIARAGNVIGGGDVSIDRLMPDMIDAFSAGRSAAIRNPAAVRPWQHVLDCLNGYLLLVDALLAGEGRGAWNFGPEPTSFRTVQEVANLAADVWGESAAWHADAEEHPHEAALLTLDAGKSRQQLGWADRLTFDQAVAWTIEWTKEVQAGVGAREVTMKQITDFNALGVDQR